MKKSLLTLLLLGALGACSPSDNAKQTASPASSAPVAAQSADGAGLFQYKEKLDIVQIGLALKEAGFAEMAKSGKEVEWEQRLVNAQNDEEVKAVLQEQLVVYRKAAEQLASKKMESEQGREVHEKLLRGLQGIQSVLEQIIPLNLNTPEGMAQANELGNKTNSYMRDIAESMQLWVAMMKNNGFNPDMQAAEDFREKIKQLEQQNR